MAMIHTRCEDAYLSAINGVIKGFDGTDKRLALAVVIQAQRRKELCQGWKLGIGG